MHLQRIRVPEFRALKDVDITFEKEFTPRIFPLGSQNCGGKSTLLQLIFVLLHCSMVSERKPFLRNLLKGFKIYEGSNKRILATIDIWERNQIINVEFFAIRDLPVIDILTSTRDGENSDRAELKFSALAELEAIKDKIPKLEKEVRRLENSLNKLDQIKIIENDEERRLRLRKEILDLRSGLKIASIVDSIAAIVNLTDLEIAYEKLQNLIELSNITLVDLQKKADSIEKSHKNKADFLKSNNIIYLCNYCTDKEESEAALLCSINNGDITQAESFLKELSEKIFLAAPATQMFLFIAEESRKTLFRQHSKEINNYYAHLIDTKYKLPGFFTYELLPVELLIESFIAARDRDFIEAIETGEYGNNYKSLTNALKLILVNKRISINKDFSEISFKLDRNGENVELYPEDLSHGELKRLSIYMWIKYRNIENAIVLMDEVETALHPDWQYQIISDLIEWSPSNQYILTTHSYELCQAVTPAHVKEIEPKLIKKEG